MKKVTLTFTGENVDEIAQKFNDCIIDGDRVVHVINSLFNNGIPNVEKIEMDDEDLNLYFHYPSNTGE